MKCIKKRIGYCIHMNHGKIFCFLVLVGLCSNVILFGICQSMEADAWGHALHGRIICEKGRFPSFSDYSWVSDDTEPRALNCVPQIILYLFSHTGGYYGFLALRCILLGLCCYFLWQALRLWQVPFILASFSFMLFMIVSYTRFLPRPDFFSLLFWTLYLYLLEKFWQKEGWYIWLLIPLELIWGNLHQLAVAGVALILVYSLGCFGYKKKSAAKTLLLIACIAFAASFCNTSGYRQILAPFFFLGASTQDKTLFSQILEFRPLTSLGMPVSIGFYWLITVTVILLWIIEWRRLRWHYLLLFIGVLVVSLRYSRFIGFFALSMAFLVPLLIWEFIQHHVIQRDGVARHKQAFSVLTAVAVFACHGCLSFLLLTGSFQAYNSDGLLCRPYPSNTIFPVEAVKFLQNQDCTGNIFTEYNTGAYVAYHMYPKARCFVNSLYLSAYSRRSYQLYDDISEGRLSPQSVALSYQVHLFVLNYQSNNNDYLLDWLWDSPDWQIIYLDEANVIFADKHIPFTQKILREAPLDIAQTYKVPRIACSADHLAKLGVFFIDRGYLDAAETIYKQALQLDPSHPLTLNNLGILSRQKRNFAKALEWFVKSAEMRVFAKVPQKNIVSLFEGHIRFEPDNPWHQRARRLCPAIGQAKK